MFEKYDLNQLLEEIKEDESVGNNQKVRIVSQDEIQKMLANRKKRKKDRT